METTSTTPTHSQMVAMSTTDLRSWMNIASDQLEALWDDESCAYRSGFEDWARVEDTAMHILIGRH
jgi:hypothetical protein